MGGVVGDAVGMRGEEVVEGGDFGVDAEYALRCAVGVEHTAGGRTKLGAD